MTQSSKIGQQCSQLSLLDSPRLTRFTVSDLLSCLKLRYVANDIIGVRTKKATETNVMK